MTRCIVAVIVCCSTAAAHAAIIPFQQPAPSPIADYLPVYTTLTHNPKVDVQSALAPGYRNVTTGFWVHRSAASWIDVWAEAFIASVNLAPYAADASLDLEIGRYYNGQGATASYRVFRFNGGPLVISYGQRVPEPAGWMLATAAMAAVARRKERTPC